MKKIHIAAIALLIGLAAVLGTFAAARTASIGAASRHANDAAYTARVNQLDAFSAKLRHALAAKPRLAPVPAQVPTQATAPAAVQPRVVYRRPPAIVVVKHSSHGDDGAERSAEGGGGGDD